MDILSKSSYINILSISRHNNFPNLYSRFFAPINVICIDAKQTVLGQ